MVELFGHAAPATLVSYTVTVMDIAMCVFFFKWLQHTTELVEELVRRAQFS